MARRWAAMLERCYVEENQSFEWYGARGISVCEEWFDFETFFEFWGEPPFPNATIGRIDNDGNYTPDNCRWETQAQQNNNSVRSRRITWKGRTQTLRDWAREYNVGMRRLWERHVRRGWDFERALTTPCPKGFDQEAKERKERADQLWQLNGHLYNARSRHRRKIRLGLHTQDLLAVEGADPAPRPSRYAQNIDKVLALRSQGLSIRKISTELGIGKSTISAWLRSADSEAAAQP